MPGERIDQPLQLINITVDLPKRIGPSILEDQSSKPGELSIVRLCLGLGLATYYSQISENKSDGFFLKPDIAKNEIFRLKLFGKKYAPTPQKWYQRLSSAYLYERFGIISGYGSGAIKSLRIKIDVNTDQELKEVAKRFTVSREKAASEVLRTGFNVLEATTNDNMAVFRRQNGVLKRISISENDSKK